MNKAKYSGGEDHVMTQPTDEHLKAAQTLLELSRENSQSFIEESSDNRNFKDNTLPLNKIYQI